jgi:hypothetical protein
VILVFSIVFGIYPWNAAFLTRSHGVTASTLGLWLGMAAAFGGGGGVLLGGYVASRWFENQEKAQLRMCALSVALTVPTYLFFLTTIHTDVALFTLIPLTLLLNFYVAPTYALMQRLVHDEVRATSIAIVMLLYNLIGMGVAPQIVGTLSDLFLPRWGMESLRYAMLSVSVVGLWAAYHLWRAGDTAQEDLQSVAERSADGG